MMTYLEMSAGTGAFDALVFRDAGSAHVGAYLNQKGLAFLFRFEKMFARGTEEVDNTVHLPPDAYERLKETQPELLEKMAHTIPLVYVEGSRERSRFSDGLNPEFSFDADGNRLPRPEPMDPALYAELTGMLEAFGREWLWQRDDPSPEARLCRDQLDSLEWQLFPVNVKPSKRSLLAYHDGHEEGTLSRYTWGLDTAALSTEEEEDYNVLNLLVEVRHTAQVLFERWY